MRTNFRLPTDAFAIVATLEAINGPASFHVITSAEPLMSACRRAEMQMDAQGIPEADRIGARVRYASAGGKRRRSAVSAVVMTRDSEGWTVVEITKRFVGGGTREFFALDLFDHAPGVAYRNEVSR